MCRADILDMSATDKNICHLGSGADRHICQHCQPSIPIEGIYGVNHLPHYTRQHLVLITKCKGITNVDRVKVNIVIILVIVVDVPIIASAIVVIKQRR